MSFEYIYNYVRDNFMLYSSLGGLALVVLFILFLEPLCRYICRLVVQALYKIRIHGTHHIPPKGACLIVANHVSFIDWLLIMMAARRPVRFVIYHSFMKMPFISFFLKMGQAIPIAEAKVNPQLLEEAMNRISEHLRKGEIVCIFPEGQLTLDGRISSFKPGIERILKRDPVPVVPVFFKGLWHTFFSLKTKDLKAKLKEVPSQLRSNVLVFIEPAWPSHAVSAKELENHYRRKIEGGELSGDAEIIEVAVNEEEKIKA